MDDGWGFEWLYNYNSDKMSLSDFLPTELSNEHFNNDFLSHFLSYFLLFLTLEDG